MCLTFLLMTPSLYYLFILFIIINYFIINKLIYYKFMSENTAIKRLLTTKTILLTYNVTNRLILTKIKLSMYTTTKNFHEGS